MTAPLHIGILGAARIADEGIVAARDRSRAEAFAAERGIAKVHGTYADVIADPDVELIDECYRRVRLSPRYSGDP